MERVLVAGKRSGLTVIGVRGHVLGPRGVPFCSTRALMTLPPQWAYISETEAETDPGSPGFFMKAR